MTTEQTKTQPKLIRLDGRVAKAPELKTSKADKPYFKALFINVDDDGSENWVNLLAFGAFATNLSNRVKKGDALRVKGKLTVKEYAKKDGSVGVDNSILLDEVTLEGGVKISPFDGAGVEAF